jgi:creatinine amidohydrolase
MICVMSAPPHRYWHEMTAKEFSSLDAGRAIAVLPVGAIEQHGPHLPVGVDSAVSDAVVRRALTLIPQALPVLVLPVMPVGKSNEHLAFGGTLTLSAETLTRLWTEIAESVARAGVRKIVFVNSHGGQPQIVDIVARDLRVRLRMLAVAVNTYGLGYPAGLVSDHEMRHGIHAGAAETSLMLHLHPDLVHHDAAENFEPLSARMEQAFTHLTPTGPVRFAWQIQDLHPSGACGDATNADGERGRLILEHAARRLAEVLVEVDRFPLENLRGHPA